MNESQLPIDPAAVRRISGCGIAILSVLAVGFFALLSAGPYADFLWFAHDVRHPEVFSKVYETEGLLFVCAFIPTWLLIYASLRQAFTLSLIYLRKPDSIGGVVVGNAIVWFQSKGATLVRYVSPLVAFVLASQLSGEWNTYLLATHAQTFGMKDPTFGMDIGFFVFTLPWYRALSNYVFATLFLSLILTVGLYVGLQALAALAKIELSRPHIRLHVSLLIGASLIAFGVQNGLRVYEAGFVANSQFTGAGYADMQSVGALRIFSILTIVGGLAVIAGWKVGKPNYVAATVSAIAGAFYILGVGLYPSLVQRFVVDPNRLSREQPYAEQAIAMTRYAYALDEKHIEVRNTDVRPEPSAAEIAASQTTFDNMRLWDPEIVRKSFQGLQAVRTYYRFNDVDVDRYKLNGRQTEVMLSPRDIDIQGVSPAARNWTNDRLYYTHGYGVVVVPVNAATPDGRPDFLIQGVPETAPPSLPVQEPRVYFSDFRDDDGNAEDEYAIVRTSQPELDYEKIDATTVTSSWQGDRGVPIAGLLSRLAFSVVLGDGNLLVTPRITDDSRLLVHRNILDRAQKLYPFLKFDRDPCLVILDGRLVWLMDAYTTSQNVPYSDRLVFGDSTLNYIHNSVKVTIDAYSGLVNAYAIQPDEPILKAYREIYPGLIRDFSELPAGLEPHLRYPEDLFSVQSYELERYHVTDARVFLSNGDAWQIAKERDIQGNSAEIQPYYVQMQLPDEPRAGFLLIRPFTPNGKSTMSGWLAAHSDPGDYGRLTMYRFVNQSPVAGPELMEANFNSTPAISNINRQYQNAQSDILVGNLLVIPIGQSVMYVEPLYLQSRTAGITPVPRLFRVVLALNDRVVVGETYKDALNQLFGEAAVAPTRAFTPAGPTSLTAPSTTSPPSGPGALGASERAKVTQAANLLDEADEALRKGDFGKYGDLQKQARALLRSLAGK